MESENNDSIANANVISRDDFGIGVNPNVGNDALPHVVIDGFIGGAGTAGVNDVDYYRFDLLAGETLTLDIDGGAGIGSSVDTQLFVFDGAGTLLTSNDDAFSPPEGGGSVSALDSFLNFTAGSSGTFYVAVSSFNNDPKSGTFNNGGGSSGDYILNASLTTSSSVGGLSVDEDTALAVNGISISDVDVNETPGGEVSVTVSADNGTIALADVVGLSSVTGDGTGSVTLQGSLAEVNEALDGLTYQGDLNFNGTDTVTVSANDLGNTGSGGAQSDLDSFEITVNPVNDAPVAVDDSFATLEDVPFNGNLLVDNGSGADSDVDVGDALSTVPQTLTTALGASVTILANGIFSYSPALNANGADSFAYTVTDGHGGTDSATASVSVAAVNDAPVVSFVGPAPVNLVSNSSFELGTTGFLTGGSTAITDWVVTGHSVDYGALWPAADGIRSIDMNGNDAGGVAQTVATVAGGTYSVSFDLAGNQHDAPDEKLMHVETDGSLAGAFSFTTTTGDIGWTTQTFSFTAADASTVLSFISDETASQPGDVRDGPALDNVVMIRTGADFFVNEDTALVVGGLSVSDVDVGETPGGEVSVTVAAASGTVTLADLVGLSSVSGDGTGSVTLQGSLAEVNEALDGLTYQGNLDFNGADTLTVSANDLGNTGSGGALTDVGSVSIIVDPVNDAPVAADFHLYTNVPAGGSFVLPEFATVAHVTDPDVGDSHDVTGISNVSGALTAAASGAGDITITMQSTATGGPIPLGHNLVNGLGGTAGFGEQDAPVNDDGSHSVGINSVFEDGLNFFGTTYNSLFINTNGNVTFNNALSTFTPFALTGATSNPIIAPYFADVDTRGGAGTATPGGNSTGANVIHYDFDTVGDVMTITWNDVGYFNQHTSPLNAFQLQLFDRSNGDFDIVFRYEDINWTTGDASGGSGGLGGTVARAGWNSGAGVFEELGQSGNQAAMLALESTLGNTGSTGFYAWQVRGGAVSTAPVGQLDYSVVDSAAAGDTGTVFVHQTAGATITGGDGDDVLIGDITADVLNGGLGNDILDGGEGKDVLNGGAGDDTLLAGFDDGTGDVFNGGAGTDTYQIDGTVVGGFFFDTNLATGTDVYGNTYISIENVIGGAAADNITGNGANNVIDGRGGNDILTGGGGSDTFAFNSAGDGVDTVTDFTAGTGGDTVDISHVLTGFTAGNEADFVELFDNGTDTTVRVDANGGANSFVDLVVLQGVTGIDLATLLVDDNIVVG